MSSKRIIGFRALGILERFLVANAEHIDHWLLPSTICFSIPFLFTRLNKKIAYYDYGYTADLVLNKIKDANTGILLVDYYAKPWTVKEAEKIKAQSAMLIHDRCLSAPETSVAGLVPDLMLFSTGKGKVIDLGIGATGFYQDRYDTSLSPENNAHEVYENYEHLDRYWKNILAGNEHFDEQLVKNTTWIDHSPLDETTYLANLLFVKDKRLGHKMKLNSIYQQLLAPALLDNSIGNEWRFNILVDQPALVLSRLSEAGLFASNHYASAGEYLDPATGKNEQSSYLKNHIINLFNDQYYTAEQAEQTASVLNSLYLNNLIKPVPQL